MSACCDKTQTMPATCTHCGAAVALGVEFCCSGCETAYHTAKEIAANPSAHIGGRNAVFSFYAVPYKKSDDANTPEGEAHQLTLSVSGIHCASCIRLIENALSAESDVFVARVNMSTKRLHVAWRGTVQRGDALAEIVQKLGYRLKPFDADGADVRTEGELRYLLRCIGIAGFSAGNMMLLSVVVWSSSQELMGMATRDLFHWMSALIALPTVAYVGQPFFRSAWAVLKEFRTNMDVPISIAVTLACAMSVFEVLRHGEHVYFDSAVMLLFFLLIGRYLDARAKGKARESASELLSMMAGTATIVEEVDGVLTQRVIAIRDIREGMEILVATGENIPADGEVLSGNSDVDMSLVTGETLPQYVSEGMGVFSGTTNLSSSLKIRVAKASEDSLLSEIVKLLEKAEQGQARYVRMADKAAELYTPVVHLFGLLTFLGWMFIMHSPWQESLLHAVTVLIITCPCALGLAVPVVQVLASSRLMKEGVLLKSGDALERLAAVDVMVFDKTGTLTLGKMTLLNADAYNREDLQLAASLAVHSKHPLSQAVVKAYGGELFSLDVEEVAGKGLSAKLDGLSVRLGSQIWCEADDLPQDDACHTALSLWLKHGDDVTTFYFSDIPREDSAEVINALQAHGIDNHLLSGDRNSVAEHVSAALGIKHWQGELSPLDKCTIIEKLTHDGASVAMIGDGLNDAPSLASASVSMSPSTAMDITQNTADIVFQGDALAPVYNTWRIARKSVTLVKQNFALAVVYNMIAIPLAVMGYVTPLVAAVAMSLSSLIVICNAFRLNLPDRTLLTKKKV